MKARAGGELGGHVQMTSGQIGEAIVREVVLNLVLSISVPYADKGRHKSPQFHGCHLYIAPRVATSKQLSAMTDWVGWGASLNSIKVNVTLWRGGAELRGRGKMNFKMSSTRKEGPLLWQLGEI